MPPARHRNHHTREVHEMFGRQRTSATHLPDPRPLIATLAGGALEVIAGVRDVDQLARWLAQEPLETLVVRANLAARARSARSQQAKQPAYQLTRILCDSPVDGVIEATAIVTGASRTRAIAMRLEGLDRRWRATSLAVL